MGWDASIDNNLFNRNNDGYAEMTGSYELLAANQPRLSRHR